MKIINQRAQKSPRIQHGYTIVTPHLIFLPNIAGFLGKLHEIQPRMSQEDLLSRKHIFRIINTEKLSLLFWGLIFY